MRAVGLLLLVLFGLSTVGPAGADASVAQGFEIDFESASLSDFYMPIEILNEERLVWRGENTEDGCVFHEEDAPFTLAEDQIVVERKYSPTRCEMELSIGDAPVWVMERYAALSDELGDIADGLSLAQVRYRAETISIFEEPARWFPCHGTGGSVDSPACQFAIAAIKPVNTVIARLTYQPTASCANYDFATNGRDLIATTGWRYAAFSHGFNIQCSIATYTFKQGFSNGLFCRAIVGLTQDVDSLLGPLGSITGADELNSVLPTITSISSTAGGRAGGASYHTSVPFKTGGCEGFLRYSSVGRRVTL